MQLPEYVQIEPVGQCNLQCRMCPIQFRKDGPPHGPPAFMPFEMFSDLLAQFEGARHLHLQGLGEPMLHPRFLDMVRHAKARGLRVTTNTNLTAIDAYGCIESGLDELHGSLDGARAETYERIRRRARFSRVIRNIERLVEARARTRATHPHIELVFVVMRENVSELPEWVRLGARLGVDSLFVQHLCHDFGEAALPQRYSPMRNFIAAQMLSADEPDVFEASFLAARAAAAELGIRIRLPRLTSKRPDPPANGRSRCDWPWRGGYVSYTGEAMPCCMISTPDRLNFGNMVESGVIHIWNSEAYDQFRARLASNHPPDVCRTCSLYNGTF